MKFGPVPLDRALGAVLAHSISLPSGRLRKGATLTRAHLDEMAAADMTEVIVARLEPNDVAENDAALALAQALGRRAKHVHLSAPFTGRVNLLADGPGVVQLDADAIIAVNAVDPMITVATVAPGHQMQAGGMIATVKIIAYAVAQDALDKACDAAMDAVKLATPQFRSASLIVTEIPGGPGQKGADAIRARIEGLGMQLAETRVCPHDAAALADQMRAVRDDIILILTGSATSDAQDVAPMALGQAGGQLTRFGIPVDPGNLLFLGDLAGKPVIGLPGSARSPVLHGADWVLARIACGVALSDRDFAAMGVGGLLKEIPTRPQPRRAKAP